MALAAITIRPLTADRWPDLENLFGPERGAISGCWCMALRASRATNDAMGRAGRKDAFFVLVQAERAPGLLAYDGAAAVGWCAAGPRGASPRFETAKASRSVDDDSADIHAITCFYLRRDWRRRGLMATLATAAVESARAAGARAIDVCAIDTTRTLVWGEGFVGIAAVFERLGFREIARRSPTRPLLRMDLAGR